MKKVNLKATFKNKKFLRIFIPIVIVLIIIGVVVFTKLSDKGTAVEVKKVEVGTVEQYYDTTGILTSGNSEKYYIYEGVTVKEVKVRSGDAVSKGTLLATFDTSSMNSVISEKKDALSTAQKTYNDAVSSKNDTDARAAEIDRQIADLKTQKEKLESTSTTAAATTTTTTSSGETTAPNAQQIADALAQAQSGTSNMQNSASAIDYQIQILESEKSMANSGQYESAIKAYSQNLATAKAAYDEAVAEKKALDAGWTATQDGKVGEVYIKAGEPYVYVEDTSQNSGVSALLSAYTQGQTSDDLTSMLSGIVGAQESGAKKGVGLVVDSYDGYKVQFSLGKYDVQTVAVDMPAIVKYTDFEYNATVTYISARADGSSDVVSSMMGGMMGGSSSGSTSSASLTAEATISNPDNNLVMGFDTKISILTGKHENVLVIPVEALVIDEGKQYVFLYDAQTGTAKRTEIETGISSESQYEIVKGLTEGDEVIVNSSKITDGAKVYES